MVHITDYPCFHEQGYYTPGNLGAPVYETAAGRIGVAICYDRHYPEYMRALALGGAEIVFVPQAGAVQAIKYRIHAPFSRQESRDDDEPVPASRSRY